MSRCHFKDAWPVALSLLFAGLSAPVLADSLEKKETPVVALGFVEAAEAALGHDAEYRSAVRAFAAEREAVAQAKSRLLPQVAFSASYSYEDTDNIYTDEDSFYYNPDQPRSSGEIADKIWRLSVDQALFDVASYKELQASRKQVRGAEYRLQKSRQELVYRTAERYLNVLFKAQQVYLNHNIHDALALKLEQASRKSDLGVGDQLELLEVQARKDLTQTDLLQAQSDLEDEQTRLRILTGHTFTPPEPWIQGAHRVEPELPDGSEQVWLQRAEQNFDYRDSRAAADASDLRREAREAGLWPTLSLGLSYSYRDSEDEFRDREGWMASLEMRLPLYNGGKTRSAIRESLARYQSQQAMSESLLAQSEQKISLTYARLYNTSKRLKALKQSVRSSERYLEAAERGMSLNLRSQVDVLDARTQMLDVQLKLAEALNQYLLADLELRFQTGQLTLDHMAFYDQLFAQVDSADH